MLQTTPFLLFNGNCAEAMTFYHKCLDGELSLTKLGDTPMKDMLPKEKHNRIINAHLKNGDIDISATDWMASPEYDPIQGNMSAIFVTGKTRDELKVVFDKLANGADKKRFQELHELPFGVYGQFYDRYGVQWISWQREEKIQTSAGVNKGLRSGWLMIENLDCQRKMQRNSKTQILWKKQRS